jgi:hypothetical protein
MATQLPRTRHRMNSFRLTFLSSILHTSERDSVASRKLIDALRRISQNVKDVAMLLTTLPWNVVEQQNRDCPLGQDVNPVSESNADEASAPLRTCQPTY